MADAARWRNLILVGLGGSLPGAPAQDPETAALMASVEGLVEVVWDAYAGAARWPLLRVALTRRDTAGLLLGQLRTRRDASLGPLQTRGEALWRHVKELYDLAQKEVERLEKRVGATIAPAVGVLLARAPVDTATPTTKTVTKDGTRVVEVEYAEGGAGNPNDSIYSGSAIKPIGPAFPPR